MLYLFFLNKPALYPILWVVLIFCYYGILKKMEMKTGYAIIPFLAEKKIGDTMFQTRYAFWHPFILACIFAGFGLYLNPFADRVASRQMALGLLFLFLAFVNYYGYLSRLYKRLAYSFGKKLLFTIGLLLFPPLFLLILAYGKKEEFQHGYPIKLSKWRPHKWFRWLMTAVSCLFFMAEAALIFLGLGFITIRTYMPWPLVKYIQIDQHEKTKNIVSDHSEILREENMGENYTSFASITPSRQKFHPDWTGNGNTVVLTYIIGSDLETKIAAASYNIDQIKDATKQGEGLTFVIEAGGSQRWFTSEIPERSVGRYVVRNGKMERVQELDTYTVMSQKETLSDFLNWAKEAYPADRYMLVFWDHGGGLSSGYGMDALNKRKDNIYGTLMVDEIISAIKDSGITFDLVGFDACLMQDIEIALELEPYADYYIASEESEPAGGWFYTSAFSRLAKDPTLSTEEFAKEIVGCYDQYNRIISDGKDNPDFTLSVLDLTYVKLAYEKLCSLFDRQKKAIAEAEANFVDISLAAKNAYTFGNKEQIDLVHYLQLLKETDYDESVISDSELQEIINYSNACVVARNRMSASGINGLAFTFPYNSIDTYTYVYKQLKELDLSSQEDFSDDFFSIMAASRKAGNEEYQSDDFLMKILNTDLTKEEWYKTGFENYVTSAPMVNIPIHQNGDGYSLELSDSIWNIVADAMQFYYKVMDDGTLMYLGKDYSGRDDENGHPMITTDGTWIMLDGQPIPYEATKVTETDEGTKFYGTSKAKLNNETEVILYIEWDPAKDGEAPAKGRITGYDDADHEVAFMEKGTQKLDPGDTLNFLFDFYDEEGNLVASKTAGKPYYVITSDNITVSDGKLGSCVLKHGILLTDVYQRQFQTEMVETVIE